MTSDQPALDPALAELVFSTAARKLTRLVEDHPGRVPVHTTGGRWSLDDDAWAPIWTAGFLAGSLWVLAERTGDTWWRDQAQRYSRDLAPRRHDEGTHDIGFLFTPSWERWRRFEDTDEVRGVLVDAGRTMAGRFNPAGRYLSSWVDPGSTFIDIMMNIDIVYSAAEITGDRALTDVATAHAATSRRHLVRGDHTTVHEGWFDPGTGEFLRTATHQGWRADSSWVRGQAWAIHGFGSTYARTGERRFLDTARGLADEYIRRSCDRLPPNDWDEPEPPFPVETSAASIAAAGLAQLAELCGGVDGARYRQHAVRTVELLADPAFLSTDDDWDGLVRHATYHLRNGLGVDESVMWGDYYLLEAVQRLEHPVA